jgi:hypothetical protein
MKKITLTIFILCAITKVEACDICGCGVGGNYIGILPEFNKHIVGLRYRYNSLKSHIGIGGANTYLTTTELYKTTELWAGWNIGKNFRLMASMPYSFNEKQNQSITNSKNGIGDISISGYYQLLNNRHTILSNKLLAQTLWIGAGLKLPSGKYTASDKQNSAQNTNLFQLGTGSTDFSLNAMYDVRLQDFGVNLSCSFKMNTDNKYHYSYGNKLNSNVQAYYKLRVNNFSIAPNIGIMYENSKKDIDNKILVDISGGESLTGAIGMETNFKKISVGANLQTPLSQNLANGFVKANNRLMVHLSFNF